MVKMIVGHENDVQFSNIRQGHWHGTQSSLSQYRRNEVFAITNQPLFQGLTQRLDQLGYSACFQSEHTNMTDQSTLLIKAFLKKRILNVILSSSAGICESSCGTEVQLPDNGECRVLPFPSRPNNRATSGSYKGIECSSSYSEPTSREHIPPYSVAIQND